MTQWRFLLYAPQDSGNIAAELGRSDYSYWFVLNYFKPMLAQIGDVVVLDDIAEQPAEAPGRTDLRLLFMPPHEVPLEIAETSVPVFAWEYTTIPTEPWAGEPRNDWRTVLDRCRGAITHSLFAEQAVRAAVRPGLPLASLPAPVWDTYHALAGRDTPMQWSLPLTGVVLDSWQLGLRDGPEHAMPTLTAGQREVDFSGVVFTTIVNPDDGRKVWEDTITSFVWAHRDNEDATLLIKLVHFDQATAVGMAWDFMRRLAPYRCRIVAVHSYLPAPQFRDLIVGSHFVVNSSRGEGQCLPLMEFMSAGVPAIAPDHTAMAEYVNPTDALVVESAPEWTHWPHDPRRFLRCLMHPVRWDSLRDAFATGHTLVTGDPSGYRKMRESATQTLNDHCSVAHVEAGMREFLAELDTAQLG